MSSICEIARKAGVSQMTVSNVLSGRLSPRRADAVRRAEKIRIIAEELGYRPNSVARAMRSGKFNAVAMLMSADQVAYISNQMLFGAQSVLAENGLHLVFERVSLSRLAKTGHLPDVLRNAATDGLLVQEHIPFPAEVVQAIDAVGLPVVWVNQHKTRDCVYFDNELGASLAVQRFLEAGHRRIAHVCMNASHDSNMQRRMGYESAMLKAGLSPMVYEFPWRQVYMHMGDPTAAQMLYQQWAILPANQRPTAVLAYNELLASATQVAALQLGWRVPQDLSLISFANANWHTGIRLELLHLDELKMGQTATRMLLRKLTEDPKPQTPQSIPIPLLPGDSVCHPG